MHFHVSSLARVDSGWECDMTLLSIARESSIARSDHFFIGEQDTERNYCFIAGTVDVGCGGTTAHNIYKYCHEVLQYSTAVQLLGWAAGAVSVAFSCRPADAGRVQEYTY